ncbi:MAG TPA: dihydrofolate reductase family protein [Puia sp.]|nr:dihydrofolate reductase family protein [Puia sp.]
MRKLIVSTWITLDGVFDANSMGQWFNPYDSKGRQAIITEGIMACDAILLGRITYEMLAPYWSSLKNNEMGIAAKLNSVPKYVVSSSLKKAEWNNSTIIKEDVVEEITRLKQQPGREIQIEGSASLAQSLGEAGLIDEYRFLVHPAIMGEGKRFFKDGMHAMSLRLVRSQELDLGVMLVCYEPAR